MELRRPEPGKTTILISECSIFALIWTISLWPSAATVLWRWCMCLCENGHNLLTQAIPAIAIQDQIIRARTGVPIRSLGTQ